VALAAVMAVGIAGLIAGPLLVAEVGRDGRAAVDRDLRQRAAGIAHQALAPFERHPRPPFGPPPPGGPPGGLLEGSGTFVQVAAGNRVVSQLGDLPEKSPPVPRGEGLSTVTVDGSPWRALTLPVGPSGSDVRVRVLASLAPVEARVSHVRDLVIVIGLGALVLTALIAWAFTSLAVLPLVRLREGAARVSGADDLGTRLPADHGPDEVRSLARDLNEMLARLERAMKATRRFAADAGHEMRTPLTGMRANLDALERNPDLPVAERLELIRAMTAEQERVVRLLEGLQALARGDAAESLPREEVEVGDVVDAAVYGARRRHPAVRFELDDRACDSRVWGWAGGLRLVVDNLLDNAALHGREDGLVRVTLERHGMSVALVVDDDGPGISPADRERLLEPFTRGDGAVAPGTGLGLAIVSQQVALHGGSLRLADSELGGLRVDVVLTATAPPAPGQPPAGVALEAKPSAASRSKSP
jgi:signal transduction histidine kinase